MGIRFSAAYAILASALLAAGCAGRAPTVRVPIADPTPPLTALDVIGNEGRLLLFTGDGPRTVEIGPGDSVVLIALGEDRDGGVKDISLVGNAVAHCGDSSRTVPLPGKDAPETLKTGSFARRSVLPALPGWRVPGSKSTRYVLKADDFRKLCGPLELKGVTGAAGVRAVNYHGKSAMSPTLVFRIAAPAPRRAQAQASQPPQSPQPVFGPLPLSELPDTPRI